MPQIEISKFDDLDMFDLKLVDQRVTTFRIAHNKDKTAIEHYGPIRLVIFHDSFGCSLSMGITAEEGLTVAQKLLKLNPAAKRRKITLC